MSEAEVFQLVINNIREVLPDLEDHEFSYDDQLVALGANSIDRAEIVTMSMEALSLNIPRIELFGIKNVGGLASFLHSKLQVS